MVFEISPSRSEPITAFLKLAERLDGGEIEEPELSTAVARLSSLTQEQLDILAQHAQAEGHRNPRFGWAIARVGDVSAVTHDSDLLLQAKAAWYLGRAANNYFRPRRAADAIYRARAAFEKLKDEAWLAACDWQQNVLAWARPDLQQCLKEVQGALDLLSVQNSPLASYRYECRLTLAYIQTLIGLYDETQKNLDSLEESFKQNQDQLGLIRCYLIRGIAYYRQSKFEEAVVTLEAGLALAKVVPAPVEEMFCLARLGDVFFKWQRTPESYLAAEASISEAVEGFRRLDLLFWEALYRDGLSNIYISRGDLSKAGVGLAFSRQVFEEYEVDAPLAGTLITAGWLETYRANYDDGLDYLVRAEEIIQRVGNRYMLGVCQMHLGELYLEMGRYQLSLHYLEQAIDSFEALGSPGRIAECGLRLARCWDALGRPDQAMEALARVERNAKKAKQRNIFPYLYIRRAETLFVQRKQAETVEALRRALVAAGEFEDQTGAALSHRLLGETLIEAGQMAEAAENLETAEKICSELELTIEQAACKVAWGNYYQKSGNPDIARKVWRQAAEMGQHIAPDIVWQAEAGLADLAEESGNLTDALRHYRHVVQALSRLRQDMWQPTLAGYLLKRPLQVFDRAVRLAASAGSGKDVLNFIEAGKAQVMANLFQQARLDKVEVKSPELADLVADIRWRQERVRGLANGESLLGSADFRKMRRELQEMVGKYDSLRGRIERKHQSTHHELLPDSTIFNLDEFRELAGGHFGENWIALDYYMMEERVICVLITSQSYKVINVGYPGRARFVVSGLDNALAMGRWQQNDLDVIGKWLLPEEVLEQLAPDRVLLVAPHRQLNHFPWSALSAGGEPLVGRSIPVIVPSLQSLAALMGRPKREAPFDKGLLLAVSEFNGRHEPLPFTIDETKSLLRLYPESEALLNEAATWPALLGLAEGSGFSSCAFLHIASHAFADGVSGRLSGLAMFDRDVWLDELWECAPFPALITLSACSGSKSRLYEGDEQVGLATTFLAAGARHVIASLWPVKDEEAAGLMKTFYSYLLLGNSVSHALALTQRYAVQNSKDVAHWAGFRCTGLPF